MDSQAFDQLDPDPMAQCKIWFDEARQNSAMSYSNAMVLSTVSADGYPNSRVVLLKGLSAEGFCFFTNSNSTKGDELARHPRAALNWYWDDLRRQVRAQGDITMVTAPEADDYFRTRPRLSQLGAWASLQSQPLPTRSTLEHRVQEFEAQFANQEIPRPPHWNGYRLKPLRVEFWQERDGRLHDRVQYRRAADDRWTQSPLFP